MKRSKAILYVFPIVAASWLAASAYSAQRTPAPVEAAAARADQPLRSWAPAPGAIVHLSSRTAQAPSTLAPQQLWSAYAVPVGRDLVLTNVSLAGAEVALGAGAGFKRFGEAAPSLRASPLDPGAPLGWVFSGGTQVVIENTGSQPSPLSYELVGYLSPAR